MENDIKEVTLCVNDFEQMLYKSMLLDHLEKYGLERTEFFSEAMNDFFETKSEYINNKKKHYENSKKFKSESNRLYSSRKNKKNSLYRSYRYFRIMLDRRWSNHS